MTAREKENTKGLILNNPNETFTVNHPTGAYIIYRKPSLREQRKSITNHIKPNGELDSDGYIDTIMKSCITGWGLFKSKNNAGKISEIPYTPENIDIYYEWIPIDMITELMYGMGLAVRRDEAIEKN